jgi:hypothetical protein
LIGAAICGAIAAGPGRADEVIPVDDVPLKELRRVDIRANPGRMSSVLGDLREAAVHNFLAHQEETTTSGVAVWLRAMDLTVIGRAGGPLGVDRLRLTAHDGTYSAEGEGLATFDAVLAELCRRPSVAACDAVSSAPSDSARTPDGDPLPTYGVIEVTMANADREDIFNLATGFLRYKGFVDRAYSGREGLVTVEFGLRMTITITYRLSGPASGLHMVVTDGPVPPTAEEAAAMVDELAKVIASRPAATVTIVE